MTYQQAEAKMAELMKAVSNFHEQRETYNSEHQESERRRVYYELNSFGWELATYPEFYDIVILWSIHIEWDVEKSECVKKQKQLEKINNKTEFLKKSQNIKIEEVIKEEFLSLSDKINNFIKNNGFKIFDVQLDAPDFVIVHCNEPEAKKLCNLIHEKFKEEIEAKLITIHKNSLTTYELPTLSWDTLK